MEDYKTSKDIKKKIWTKIQSIDLFPVLHPKTLIDIPLFTHVHHNPRNPPPLLQEIR